MDLALDRDLDCSEFGGPSGPIFLRGLAGCVGASVYPAAFVLGGGFGVVRGFRFG